MNRRFWVYFILLALIIPAKVEGQRWRLKRYEAGFGIGTTFPFTDIGSEADGLKSFQFSDTRLAITPHIGYKLLEDLTLKVGLNYLMLGAADPESRNRNLTYTSNCFEPVVRVDFNIIGGGKAFGVPARFNKQGMVNSYGTSQVYVFAGGGGVLSKAKVKRNGIEEDPAINTAYNNNLNWGFVLPVGIGYKLTFDAYIDLAFEIGGRFTTTDLVEGYWNQTASLYKDKYIVTSFKATYKISNDRSGKPLFRQYRR